MRHLFAPFVLGSMVFGGGCAVLGTDPGPDENAGEQSDEVSKRCGNGVCNANEKCSTCPQDCGSCPGTGGSGATGTGGSGATSTGGSGATSTGGSGTGGSGGSSQPTVGPQTSITCPSGAVNISPGQDIPAIVDAHGAGTAFCVLAGTYQTNSPINLKAGDSLVGQYGAIIDGTNVTMTYDIGSTSIVRGWNCGGDCSGALVQNLVIHGLADHSCVGIYAAGSDNWTVDHNEIYGCRHGVNAGTNSGTHTTNNLIHDNGYSGFAGYMPKNSLVENNELYKNGAETGGSDQKVSLTTGMTFRNNHYHDQPMGIWLDGENTNALIEGNLLEDLEREGVFHEISGSAVIRNNTIRRNAGHAIFISTSQDVEIYGNVLEDNFRGIQYFLNCDVLSQATETPGFPPFDLKNLNAHDNTIVVGTTPGALANLFGYSGNACTSTLLAAYVNGSKNLVFQNNGYRAPTLTDAWWLWGDALKTWSQWQALGQDTTGTLGLP
jgi:parallel beta-helix repeat protein